MPGFQMVLVHHRLGRHVPLTIRCTGLQGLFRFHDHRGFGRLDWILGFFVPGLPSKQVSSISTMQVNKDRWAAWVMAFRMVMWIRQAVFLLIPRSLASCRAEMPFLSFSISLRAKNHVCRGRWVRWKRVPTVTLNEVWQE